jgi:hypothetical protein
MVAMLAGCPHPPVASKDMESCSNVVIGDPGQPIQAVLAVSDGTSTATIDVTDGAAVPLVTPPQGGKVTYTTARVRNLDSCGVSFKGRYRDPATGVEIGFDGRTADLVIGADGWGRVDPTANAAFTNIPACPDYGPQDVQGRTLLLELVVTDRSGRTVTVSHRVVPTCMQADATERALCICTCSANFSPGRCADAGT